MSALITDGAWGTELQKLGLPAGQLPDTWNLTRPQIVEQVARSYVHAGSAIILTNTFQANAIRFPSCAVEINRAGVEISKRAAGGRARVFGSIGPAEENAAAFLEQALALAEAGAEALVIETMTSLEEARLALRTAKRTGLPVIVSFTFVTGLQPAEVAETMEREGAAAVGVNCMEAKKAALICRALLNACGLPIWAKPSAGLPQIQEGRAIYNQSPKEFAVTLLNSGARFLGGCCGTTPAFIRALIEARPAFA